MDVGDRLHLKDLTAWRNWLNSNHDTESEVWVTFYKDGTEGISYADAVEEALCWGWIDSLVKRIDEREYVRKFTPRRAGSNWSASNRKRVRKLLDQGRMMEPGLAAIKDVDLSEAPRNPVPAAPDTPPAELARALKRSPDAERTFRELPQSERKKYTAWILDAKKSDTKSRRIAEAVESLARGKRLGLK